MIYYLFGLSRPIDQDWLVENKQRKLRFMRSTFRGEDRPVVEAFIRLLLTEPELDPDTAYVPASLAKISADPLLIPKLCASGLLTVEASELRLGWRNETAAFTISKYLASVIEDGSVPIQDAMSMAEKIDRVFQTHLFTPLKWALDEKKRKTEVVNYLGEQVKNSFQAQIYTGHTLNGSSSDPEFPWGQQLRFTEREHPLRSTEKQRHFLFFLELFHYLKPDFATTLIGLAQTPIQFLMLQRRMDVADPAYFLEPIRSHASSFIAFSIKTQIKEEYGRWTHEAQKWRGVTEKEREVLLTPLELLREKAKLDESVITLAKTYIDSLPSPLTAQHVHTACLFVDDVLESMRIQWQASRYDTDGLRAPLLSALARQLSTRAQTETHEISAGLSEYLFEGRSTIDDRFAIVAGIGMSPFCEATLKPVLRNAILQRIASFLSNPFTAYPHFPQKVRFERNLSPAAQLLLEDEVMRQQFFNLLQSASSAQFHPPEKDTNQDFNRVENCAYFSRIALLSDLSKLSPEERGDTIGVLKQCYREQLKTAPSFGAAQGLVAEFVKQGIISSGEVEKPDRWSEEEVRQMSAERRRYYSRHLIDEGEYSQARRILEESEREAWAKGSNNAGQTSEGIYNLMLSLYLDVTTTTEEYADAVKIFERNRECIGVDPESAYTLASVMAERSRQFPKALQFIDCAAHTNPGNLDHWLNKIVILLKSQDGMGAHKLSEEIPSVYHDLDRVAHLRLAAHVSAMEHLPRIANTLADHLIERHPTDYDARYNKAVAHIYAGQFGQAIAIGRKIIEDFPGDPQVQKILLSLETKTRSQNLDLLANGIAVRFPVRIGGEFFEFPLHQIEVGQETRSTTRIAIAQIGIVEFPKKGEEIPVSDAPRIALTKIGAAIVEANNHRAEMIFLPELTIPHELQSEVQALAKKYSVWLIGGARYQIENGQRINRSVLVTPDGSWHDGDPKIEPAPAEARRFPDFAKGSAITVFHGTPVGKIAVLICFDFYEPGLLHCLRDEADLIFVPSANPDSGRLKSLVCSHSSSYGVPVVVANATGFGLSYYGAYCFKSEILEKANCEVFEATRSEKVDRVFCVTVPDEAAQRAYLAPRPGHRRVPSPEKIPGSL
jgi:tetratricopeptide (TPR) repeat protein